MLRGFGDWLEGDPRDRFCMLIRRNYRGTLEMSMIGIRCQIESIELESLRGRGGGGGSYFWKGGVREKEGSDEPPSPPVTGLV